MADLDRLYTALRNADAAGDIAAATRIAQLIRSEQTPETPEAPKAPAGFTGAFKEAFTQTGRIGPAAAAYVADPTEEKARKLAKLGESKYEQMDFDKAQSAGDYWEALKELAGGSLGQMVAPLAAAGIAGSEALPTGVAAPFIGVGAGLAVGSAQYAAQNALRSAQEQIAALEKGEKPNPVDIGKLAVASAAEAGLDVLEVGYFKKLFKFVPGMGKFLGEEGEKASEEATKKLVKAYEDGKLTYAKKAGIGVVKGAGFEVPQEVAQQALERWQAGLSLTDDDALNEYKNAAVGALVLGGLAGSVQGVVQNASDKAAARAAQEEAATREVSQIAPETKEAPAEIAKTTVPTEAAPQEEVQAAPAAPAEETAVTPQEEVQAAPVAPAPQEEVQAAPAEETEAAPIVGFKTAKGSVYTINEEGQTTRDKAERPEHPGQKGVQPTSVKTVYVAPDAVSGLGIVQAEGKTKYGLAFDSETNSVAAKILNGPDKGKLVRDTVVPYSTTPEVGMVPVEYWGDRKTIHFGNPITEVIREAPKPEASAEIKAAKELIAAVDKGGIALNPAKVRKIAEGLGLEVKKSAKPLDTVARIREAVARAEATQVTPAAQPVPAIQTPAPEVQAAPAEEAAPVEAPAVTTPAAPAAPEINTEATPPEMIARYEAVRQREKANAPAMPEGTPTVAAISGTPEGSKAIVGGAKAVVEDTPVLDSETSSWLSGQLSLLPDWAAKLVMPLMSIHQMVQTFKSKIPAIASIEKQLEDFIFRANIGKKAVSDNVEKWDAIMRQPKNAKYIRTFNSVVQLSTLTQVDPETGKQLVPIEEGGNPEYVAMRNEMLQAWKTLPDQVKQVYRELKAAYGKYHDEYLKALKANMSTNSFEALRKAFEEEKLGIYFPLHRDGNYWLKYINSAGFEVVRAFKNPNDRKLAKARAERLGGKEFKEYSKISEIRKGAPPTGAYAEIIKTLENEGASPEVLDAVYETYLNFLPSKSIRQQFRARKREHGLFGVFGADEDAMTVYAKVAPRMSTAIAKLSAMKDLDTARQELNAQATEDGSNIAVSAAENVAKRIDAVMNPTFNKVASAMNTFTYFNTLIANPSSALINMTQLPTVVYPLLMGKFGHEKTKAALSKATGDYFRRGGKDDNSVSLRDRTAFVTANGRPLLDENGNPVSGLDPKTHELAMLYKELRDRGALIPSTNVDLGERQKSTTADYTGVRAKVMHGLSWIFQNSERSNREITAIAAFNLAKGANMNTEQAIQYAVNVVKDAHGVGHAALGPTLFQSGFGRVIGLYKRFALNQIYLVSRLYKEAFKEAKTDADVMARSVARKQLIGVYLMTGAFAGAQGMPLVGAGMVMARLLAEMFGDDDEPFDPDAWMRDAMGDIGYKGPVNKLLGVDIAGRTGFSGLLWKDDPKRISEVGLPLFVMEQLIGPSYGVARNYQLAMKQFGEGDIERAFETALPVTPKNVLKGIRYATEGALNKDGTPIVKDVSGYDAFVQLLGFNPVEISEARARAGAMKMADKAISDRKTALGDQFFAARMADDVEGMQEVAQKVAIFNSKFPAEQINLANAVNTRFKKMMQSVDGVRLTPKRRQYLIEHFRTGETEYED